MRRESVGPKPETWLTTVPQSIRKLVRKLSWVDRKIEHARALFEYTQRAVLGIEPRTSHTLSENHTTRPNSQMMINKIALLICARINFLRTPHYVAAMHLDCS